MVPPSLYKLTGLLAFFLNGNHLTGGVSQLIGQLNGNLTILDFSNNNLTGYIPSTIGNLKQLHSLNLSHNKLSGSLPQTLGNLTGLCIMTLDDNQFSGTIPEVLATNLKKLIYMDLSSNKLTGPIPQGAPFSSFPISSFDSNGGLCGNPLPPCQSSE
jgi:Leucine-rich repeat (LRR) protein